jgi:hypothetical protein
MNMKKALTWFVIAGFALIFISSCGSRRGDKCPGVGKAKSNVVNHA